MGLRSFLVKILSFVDYYNDRDNIEIQTNIKYSQQHNFAYGHKPQFDDDNETLVYVFDSLELYRDYMNDATGTFPQHNDMQRSRILSTSMVNGIDGKSYIIVTTLQCSCSWCMARPVYNKYFDYNLKYYKGIENVGFDKINYATHY